MAFLLFSQNSWADLKSQVSNLDDRLFNLEEKLEGKFPVTPIDAKKLRLGGILYHDQRYAVGEDKCPAGFSCKNSLMSSTRMDIMVAGDLTDKIDYLFVPVWYFHSPRANADAANRRSDGKRQTMTLVSRLNFRYKFSGNHSMTVGRFMAPFSSYVDTYSLNADKLSARPQMVSPLGIVFAPILDGFLYTGKYFAKNISFQYKLYAALHATDGGAMAETPFQKYLFNGTPSKHRYGFRTIFGFWHNRLQLGLSGQFGERFYGENTTIKPVYRKVADYGVDLNLNLGKLKLRAEYVKTNEESVANSTFDPLCKISGSCPDNPDVTFSSSNDMRNFLTQYLDSNKESYYVEATYTFNPTWMLAFRYDYMDFASYLFAHGKAKTILETTINFFPTENLMLKFSVDKHDYDATADDIKNNPLSSLAKMSGGEEDAQVDPDYMEYSLSATLSF